MPSKHNFCDSLPPTGNYGKTGAFAAKPKVDLKASQLRANRISAEQLRFYKLLALSETLTRQMEAVSTLAEAHRSAYWGTLRPLEDEREKLMRTMALWLDARLQSKGLSAKQRWMAREMICNLTADLAMEGDETMRQLHDTHSLKTLADEENAALAGMQQFMKKILGYALRSLPSAETTANHFFSQFGTADTVCEPRPTCSYVHPTPPPQKNEKSAAQSIAEQLAQDADNTLRTIYRQLVSALHPDREPDAKERERKTAMMKEVNTAYERRDLHVLLRLQMRVNLSNGSKMAALAREKVMGLIGLLKERTTVLEQQVFEIQRQMRFEFGLSDYQHISAAVLKRHLMTQKLHLESDIFMIARDLQRVQNDGELKRWLSEQHKLTGHRNEPASLSLSGLF
jgi:hypothetical protein